MLDLAQFSGEPLAPSIGSSYLSHCPALSPDLAQLAEDSDYRPLLRSEKDALAAAVWACAAAIRMARPALVHAQIEGRIDCGE